MFEPTETLVFEPVVDLESEPWVNIKEVSERLNANDRAFYRLAANNAGIVIDTEQHAVKYVAGTDASGFITIKRIQSNGTSEYCR